MNLRVKGNSRPFGGVQVVVCGDFFQLPPIGIGRGTTRFCFEAKTWDTAIDQSIVLKQVCMYGDSCVSRLFLVADVCGPDRCLPCVEAE